MATDKNNMSSREDEKRSESEAADPGDEVNAAADARKDGEASDRGDERKESRSNVVSERSTPARNEDDAERDAQAHESSEPDDESEKEATRKVRVKLPSRPPSSSTEPNDERNVSEEQNKENVTADIQEEEDDEDGADETAAPSRALDVDPDEERPAVRRAQEPARPLEEANVPAITGEPKAPAPRRVSKVSAAREERSDEDDDEEITGRERIVRGVVLALLLVVATVLAYQKAWHAGFIWDDDVYVTTNELLTAPDGLKRIWLSLDSPSQYFPLVYTSFRIEHALWGLNASGYHWVNIAFHVANALLLWRLLSVLALPGAWLGAALFALHPMHVESVAWISERKNVLMGFFFLLALLAWHKFVAGKRRGSITFYLLALLCFALALASKTTACMLPVALLLISWLKRGAISLARVIQVIPFVLLGVGMGLVTIWWERYHQGTQGELFAIGALDRVLVAARGFWFYLYKLAWPAELAFSYPRWNISAADPADYVWLLACIILAVAIWIARRWIGRGPEVALMFFFAMLAPTLGFVMLYTFRYTFVADHYAYLASIGPLALVGAAVSTALNPLGRIKPFLLPVLCAALLIPLGWRTWQHSGVYHDEETLWRSTLAVNPRSWMAHNNLAIQLLNRDELDEAVTHFEEALRLDPNYAEARFNLGNAFFRLRRAADARREYERALELNPRIAVAQTNLGILLLELGETKEGIKHLEEAVRIEPRAAVAQQRLSDALVKEGREAEAVQHFEAAAKVDPAAASTDAQNLIALALLREGKPAEALAQANRTLEATPNSTTALTNYGIILAELRQLDEAVAQFEKALEIDASNAEAHYNLGNALLMRREVPEAMKHFQEAVALRPDYAAAHLNLGNTLAESGRSEEAIAEYEKALAIRPDYANAHTNLATALNRLGRFDEAMTHLQAAWKLEAQARAASPTPSPAR